VIRYASSWRAVPLDEALRRASAIAPEFGISRVTDITRLDRLGVPVFASVRPGAATGSLCVNAGKGLTSDEARVGALMEAIEFALGEVRFATVQRVLATAREVLAHDARFSIVDLCPLAGAKIYLDEPMECVVAEDLDGEKTLVPAELVFFPFPLPPGKTLFQASTNGLASGSTQTEATLHGLFEAIERDAASFDAVLPRSLAVRESSLPEAHADVVMRIRRQGLDMALRWIPNDFDIACVHAVVWERAMLDPIFMTEGYGCHLDPNIALTRAMTEAVQGRLSFIHGGRDDIQDRHHDFSGWPRARKRVYAHTLVQRARRQTEAFDLREAIDWSDGAQSLEDLLARVRCRLHDAGLSRILRVEMTPPGSPVAVVRVIVPGLEYFSPRQPRVGPRLAAFVNDA